MKYHNHVSMLAALTLLASCSGENEDAKAQSPDRSHLNAAVSFNNGAKWTADPGTNKGVDALRMRVSDSIPKIEPANLPQLVAELEREHALLLKNTTMKDEAYKQFEIYMHSVKKTIDSLKQADPKTAKDVLINLDNQLKTYSAYFG